MEIVKNNNSRNTTGFTLIEMIVYIALFSIIIGGAISATHQIISSTYAGNNHTIIDDEANFLLRKINWALTGASSFTAGTTLTVLKSGSPALKFSLDNGNLVLARGMEPATILNTSSVEVSKLTFSPIASSGVEVGFILNSKQDGRNFIQQYSLIKYLEIQ